MTKPLTLNSPIGSHRIQCHDLEVEAFKVQFDRTGQRRVLRCPVEDREVVTMTTTTDGTGHQVDESTENIRHQEPSTLPP